LPCSAFLQLVETIDPLKPERESSEDQSGAALAALVQDDAA
jgi:hypothetical protein